MFRRGRSQDFREEELIAKCRSAGVKVAAEVSLRVTASGSFEAPAIRCVERQAASRIAAPCRTASGSERMLASISGRFDLWHPVATAPGSAHFAEPLASLQNRER